MTSASTEKAFWGRSSIAAALVLVVGTFSPSAFAQTAKPSVRDGLKEVGWSVLPTFLDAATDNITIKFPKAMGGGQLTFGGTIDAAALREKKFVFTTSEAHKLTWSHAFGLPWLNLTNAALKMTVAKGEFSMAVDGQVSGALGHAGGGARNVTLAIEVENRQIKDFVLSLPDTALALAAVPGADKLPGAKDIKIAAPTVSRFGIGGKIRFKGETIDALAFHNGAGDKWVVAWQLEKPLTIGQLINHDKGFLHKIGLPKMLVSVSNHDINAASDALPLAAQNFYTAAGGLPDGKLTLKQGVNLATQFNPANVPADIRSGLAKLGLNEVLPITGVIGGMFPGQEPSIEIAVQIDPPKGHGFPFLKVKNNASAQFFMALSKAEEAVGFKTSVELPGGKGQTPLEFDVAFEVKQNGAVLEAAVSGAMIGDWRNAAGIRGFTLENPFLSAGVNETGGIDVMIDGTVLFGSEKVRAAADIVLQPEAAFVPDAVGFAGTLDKLSFPAINAHAAKTGSLKGGGLGNIKAELRDLGFAFMTPGATLPAALEAKFKIEGAGMAANGKLYVNGKELGEAGGYVSTEGIRFDGKLNAVKLGPLDLKGEELLVQAGPSVDPRFMMKGEVQLFKGFDEKYQLELQPDKFVFTSDTKFGGAFDAELRAESDGLSFSPENDFSFEALLAAKYSEAFKTLMQAAVQTFKKGEHDITKAENDVKAAERKVADLNTKIDAAKAKARRDYQNASGKIEDAQRKVDGINRTIHNVRNKIHDLQHDIHEDKKHLRLDRAAKHGIELAAQETALAADEAALKTATAVLKAAKGATKVGTEDISPEVRALQAELATAEAGLKTAQGVLELAKDADKGLAAAAKAISAAANEFKLNKLGASGSIKGIVTGGKEGQKPMLVVDCTILGKHHVYKENIDTVAKEFETIAKSLANTVAKDLVNALKAR